MNKNRIIVAGCRDFNNYAILTLKLDKITINLFPELEVVSGGARGADALGERWASVRDIECIRFPAEWNKYGKSAGPKRNEEMAIYSTHLVAFWDGKSRGTKHMIDTAKKHRLPVRVIKFK